MMPGPCTSCSVPLPVGSRFCPTCGSAVDPADRPTLLSPSPPRRPMALPADGAPAGAKASAEPSAASSWSSEAMDQGRFVPGQMLGNRYRVVELLGRGGMGEIYRADDLRLGQSVALKFLPESLASDPAALARLNGEVRMARQVSHPSVCRVYDIEDEGGRPFLAMEYVDGEDLASLLRRIGRLPSDKGVEIARQICAGLAAAHDRGVLHRDLKPGNVMLDGRGKVRITDFGLAVVAGRATDIRSGTPAYMAPEQREGREVTARSDIYSLGVVLYELFTGRHPFDSTSRPSARAGTRGTAALAPASDPDAPPANPSTVVEGVDPAVERIILRCLERDPARRPATALAVAAALPGGDPLAAALAAGETPSPEMVAAAGARERLRPAIAWSCLAGVAVAILLQFFAIPPGLLINRAGEIKAPDALADRALEIARRVAPGLVVADRAHGFLPDNQLLRDIEKKDASKTRWNALARFPAVVFWFRTSPRALVASSTKSLGEITMQDPPNLISGMTLLQLDGQGRLLFYEQVPPQLDETDAAPGEPDWSPLFEAAGVKPADLQPAPPHWNPTVACDRRAAWTGALADGTHVRYEAGAYRGRPVFFQAILPWDRPTRMESESLGIGQRTAIALILTVLAVVLVGGVLLARRNIKSGRGDRRGAVRLGLALFLGFSISALLKVHFAASIETVNVFFSVLGDSLFGSSLFLMLYVALEPMVRRLWPDLLISWSRLLSGWVRDPLVGRDLLGGVLLGLGLRLLPPLGRLLDAALGHAPRTPGVTLAGLEGPRAGLGELLRAFTRGMASPFVLLFFLVLFRALLRRNALAIGATCLVFGSLNALNSQSEAPGAVAATFLSLCLSILFLQKFGFLFFGVANVTALLLSTVPLTADFSSWYAGYGLVGVGIVAAIAAFGFHAATAGTPPVGLDAT